MKAHVNIGSNLGNSRSLIERAVAGIALLCDDDCVKVSDIIESEPWGFESANRFLNVGVEIDTHLDAEALLARLIEVQDSICDASHRDAEGGYADREIDVDLIFLGDLVMPGEGMWRRAADGETGHSGVIVPHPRMHLRGFVLRPVAQLSPDWVHPVLRLTASEMFRALNES